MGKLLKILLKTNVTINISRLSRLREDLTAQSSELMSLQQRLRDSVLRVSELESSQLPNELEHVKVRFYIRAYEYMCDILWNITFSVFIFGSVNPWERSTPRSPTGSGRRQHHPGQGRPRLIHIHVYVFVCMYVQYVSSAFVFRIIVRYEIVFFYRYGSY